MLAILGDLHGNFTRLKNAVEEAKSEGAVAVIQLGDFGYYPEYISQLREMTFDLPVYWIDGNHESHEYFLDSSNTTTHDNCFFIPRGTVMELDGRTIAFMGGASSVDKNIRLRYKMHWSPLENIRPIDIDRLKSELQKVNNRVDMFITHIPTQNMIQKHFDRNNLRSFGMPITWEDPDAYIVESLWRYMNCPPMYSGHMHTSIIDGKCRIVDINELIYV